MATYETKVVEMTAENGEKVRVRVPAVLNIPDAKRERKLRRVFAVVQHREWKLPINTVVRAADFPAPDDGEDIEHLIEDAVEFFHGGTCKAVCTGTFVAVMSNGYQG